MAAGRDGLPGDGASGSCVRLARALNGATKLQSCDEFVARAAALAAPAHAAEMNERLSDPGWDAYLANHVRR